MKGTLFANPTFVGRGVRQPTLISVKPLVAYDEHRLFFNGISVKWQYKDIVNCTFLQKYQVLLILTDDYKIYVFTSQLQKITTLHNYDPKYIVGFEAIQSMGAFLLIGTEEVELLKVTVQLLKVTVLTNVRRTKFLSSMRFNLRKEEHLIADPKDCLKWNRGYGYQLSEDLLYVWSPMDLHFFSLSQLELRSRVAGLGKKENSLSAAIFSRHYKYTVTGMLNGEVRVWRLPTSPLYHHKEILLHTFSYHTREVEHIIMGKDHRTIISSAIDLYVCFLSLQTFQVLRVFNFSGQYSKIYLCQPTFAYAVKDNYLGQLNFGLNLQFITDLTGQPISYDRSAEGEGRLQVTLNSNIGMELDLKEIERASEANKVGLKYHYPPLKSKNIVEVLSCPFQPGRYLMMVEDGQIFGSKIEGSSGKIDMHCVLARSLDSQKHAVNQMPSCIRFLQLVPPSIDTQIMELTMDREYPPLREERAKLREQLQLVAVGGTRGSVMFLSINDLSVLYCRISYHRQRVLNVQQVWNPISKCRWLASVCQEKHLKLVNFVGGKANCIKTIFLGDTYAGLRGFEEFLVIIQPKGVFQLCQFNDEKEPTIIMNREAIDHDQDILSVDYRPDLRLLLTSGKDGRIKVWTTQKILLYEVVADEQLQYVLWALSSNILLFSNNKLYCLRQALSLSPKDIADVEEQFREQFEIECSTTLSEYIHQSLLKTKSHLVKSNRRQDSKRYLSQHQTPEQLSPKGSQTHRRGIQTQEEPEAGNRAYRIHRSAPRRLKQSLRVKTQQSLREEEARLDNDLRAVRRHEEEMRNIRRVTNEAVLPKIKPKSEDIFVNFMREKLLNKRLLTRRDITLNRIIMKNIIKDHLGDFEKVSSFKLE